MLHRGCQSSSCSRANTGGGVRAPECGKTPSMTLCPKLRPPNYGVVVDELPSATLSQQPDVVRRDRVGQNRLPSQP
jgi:hypothetical protein